MAETDLNDPPIFVDVTQNRQYPILFSHITKEPQIEETQINETPASDAEAVDSDISSIIQTFTHAGPSQSITPNKIQDIKNEKDMVTIVEKKIRCQECLRYTCDSEEKLIRHIRKVHRGENPFQCYMCDYSTYNKAVFEEHIRVHQGIKPFKCSYCPYKSASKKNAKKHEQRHRPDNPLKCPKPNCEFIARNPRTLNKHNLIHIVDNSVEECKWCKKYFLLSHMQAHNRKKLKCEHCDEVFCVYKDHSTHLSKVHGVKNKKKKPPPLVFKCALCEWSSVSKPRILLHLIHHPDQDVDESHVDITILREHGIMT